MRLATQPLREFSHKSRGKILIELFSTPLDASAHLGLMKHVRIDFRWYTACSFCPRIHSEGAEVRPGDLSPHLVFGSIHPQVWVFPVRSSSRAIRLFFLEHLMIENKIDKATKPILIPYEQFESFPKHVEEFFDLIARRPFELWRRGRSCLGGSSRISSRPNRN
jgi:hypothetical protein